jgi:hypothetical protein
MFLFLFLKVFESPCIYQNRFILKLGSIERTYISFEYFSMNLHLRQLVGTRGFAALSWPGPPVVFISLACCFASFPLQHVRPGLSTVFIPVARYFVALSSGPMSRLHMWYTGRPLLHRPLPPPSPMLGPIGLDLAGTQNQVRFISGPRFCQLRRLVEIQNPRHK